MAAMQLVPIVLVSVAVIFLSVTFGNYLRVEGKMTPARSAWLRITWIFSGIAIAVAAWQSFYAG